MKTLLLGLCLAHFWIPTPAKADLFGGDLPLLAEIVLNTLQTLNELEAQTTLAKDQMKGIKDKITRMKSIADLVQPSSWKEWKSPEEAAKRLKAIYYALPKEYRSEKADTIEAELSKAMEEIGKLSGEAKDAFLSGKELETKGADASPGVAQKLTASGTGTLVAMAAQQQVLTSHITSLLVQMLAQKNEEDSRKLVSDGATLKGIASSLSQEKQPFSSRATAIGGDK
jgi:hypothetical protein